MVSNATFNNISAISWWSVLLVEKSTNLPQVTDKLYWVKKVKNLLNGLGHSYIINNINSIKLNLNTIKQRIHDQCLQTQNANICDSQKLNFFQSVYNMGQRPPYVDVLNNRCDRATICKIRISAHPLMIERGRHLNIPSYKNANNKISFLFNNKLYSILRLTSSFISNCLNIRKNLL